jgi:hypothetical protein
MEPQRSPAITPTRPRPGTALERLLPLLPAILLALGPAACGPDSQERQAAEAERQAALDSAESLALEQVAARIDSVDAILGEQPPLTSNDRYQLRQHLNPKQVATARRLGVDPPADTAEVERLLGEAALVELEDSTRYWTVRELTHSFPYVTDDAHAMLTELGRRFQVRLDSLGLPPYRFEITSALRTAELQEDLRGGNPNAARSTSSHEFGTTVDIAYRAFSPPVQPAGTPFPATADLEPDARRELADRLARQEADRLAELAAQRASNLKAILGGVLKRMQDEGTSLPLYERGQAIFHITVGQPYPDPG